MTDSDLVAALHDLHAAVIALTNVIRHRRRTEQQEIKAVVALHQQKLQATEEAAPNAARL